MMEGFLILILFFGNSTCRALSGAGTAADACICIDFKFAVSHTDSAYRTLALTCTACYAGITDYICHNNILLICY